MLVNQKEQYISNALSKSELKEFLDTFSESKKIIRDLKNYELELRIEDLESKFSRDLSEKTFNELKELKKLQKIN